MDVLAIIGSKRSKGNTAVLTNEVAKGVMSEGHDCANVFLDDYEIEGCNGCESCADSWRCVVEDGMTELYPLIYNADALILGSPTYFYTVSADMKAFLERLYCMFRFHKEDRSVWTNYNEIHGMKHAVTVSVCEQQRPEDMGSTAEVMRKSLQSLGYRVVDEVKAYGLFGEGEAMADHDAMGRAFLAGTRLGKILNLRSL